MIGESVELVTLQGHPLALSAIESGEDYWKLIGTTGRVFELGPEDEQAFFFGRALVQFDVDVGGMGLECHNSVPNSLWILKSDLRGLSAKGKS